MNSQLTIASAFRCLWPWATAPRKSDHVLIGRIHEAAAPLAQRTDVDLAKQTAALRQEVKAGQPTLADNILAPAFALVMEAARRTLGITLYDVQLLSGLALARGNIAEMQTGEGKTFAALLPACLHALAGNGVHVMTVNAYLATRDYELLAPVFRLLGFSIGLIHADVNATAKRAAYLCDITYGPGYEFGFDYLRDQVAILSQHKPALGENFRRRMRGQSLDVPQSIQRGHAVAIVDEADSVMLDEATTPLLLASSGNAPAENAGVYVTAAQVAAQLEIQVHYKVDRATATLHLTRRGLEHLAGRSNGEPPLGLERPWSTYIEQALRAEWLYRADVDYVIVNDQIQLVDQYTGRIFPDRNWRDGLQQAIQAKAGVTITTETMPVARITRQRYLRLYRHRCGMTGTGQGAERELRDLYGLEVVVIPPHKPCQRQVLPARFFADRVAKERAITSAIAQTHRTRRPILVGTASIESSQRLACMLAECQIAFQLLNGKQDAQEADIVARAGQLDAVTLATNMAGRGTDITLGPGVPELGGLHVIATEPQQSSRVDRQLVGRAARQGDPGSCQLFVSADDTLIVRHDPSLANRIAKAADAGESKTNFAREIADLQRQVEREQAKVRRQLFDHDDWLERVLADLAPTK